MPHWKLSHEIFAQCALIIGKWATYGNFSFMSNLPCSKAVQFYVDKYLLNYENILVYVTIKMFIQCMNEPLW